MNDRRILVIRSDEHCFRHILGLIASHVSFSATLALYQGRDLQYLLADSMCQYEGKQSASAITLEFKVKSLIVELGKGNWPDSFTFEVFEQPRREAPMEHPWEVPVAFDFGKWQGISSFLAFYAEVEPLISSKFSEDRSSWPMIANFARTIRNSLAHGNAVEIRNPNSLPVVWRSCSLSHADNGRGILYGVMSFADLILLMKDVSGGAV